VLRGAVEAYKVCKERMEAVGKAWEQALSGAEVSNADVVQSNEKHGEPPPDEDMTTHPAFLDIPF